MVEIDKVFRELPLEIKAKILLAVARLKAGSIYMFHGFFNGMSEEWITTLMAEFQNLKNPGMPGAEAAVLYLTDNVLLVSKIGDSGGSLRAADEAKLEAYKLV